MLQAKRHLEAFPSGTSKVRHTALASVSMTLASCGGRADWSLSTWGKTYTRPVLSKDEERGEGVAPAFNTAARRAQRTITSVII
jgi:hypothetical protein